MIRSTLRFNRAHGRLIGAISILALPIGCGPRVQATPADGDSGRVEPAANGAGDQSAPAPAAQTTERDIARYVHGSLTGAGYRCNEDSPFLCMTNEDPWQVMVTIRNDASGTWIGFDSSYGRAPNRTCGELRALVDGLASKPHSFTVSCSDTRQEFRMATWVAYTPELDVPAWMQGHRDSRFGAYQKLDGSGATKR